MPSIFEATSGRHLGPVSGGTVTQTTSKATTVTLNAESGVIKTHNQSLGGDSIATFTVKNDKVSAGDVILVNHIAGNTLGGYLAQAVATVDGEFKMSILNLLSTAQAEAIDLAFVIFKGASS